MKKFIKIIIYIIIANIIAGFSIAIVLDLIGFEVSFNTRLAIGGAAGFAIGFFCPKFD